MYIRPIFGGYHDDPVVTKKGVSADQELKGTAHVPGNGRDELFWLLTVTRQTWRSSIPAGCRMTFQDASTALNPLMSIVAQIEDVMVIHDRISRSARWDKAIRLLESVGVPDAPARSRSLPHELSGGMRQRVMEAIALAGSPDLVIPDEPTTALDVTVQAQVLALLRESTRSSVLLFITHDIGVVAEVADRVVVMYAGAVMESGPVAEILDQPRHPYTAALLASVPDPDAPTVGELPTIPGPVPPLGERRTGCPFRDRCPRQTERCQEMPPLVAVGDHDDAQVACWHPENTVDPTKAGVA